MFKNPLLYVFAGLLAFSAVSARLLGEKGFFGDDWAIMSFPFWHRVPTAFTEGALVMRRPFQSVYYGLALKATAYDATLLFFASLVLLAVAYGLMGWALLAAFPGRRRLVAVAALFGFLLPVSAPGAYWLSADNMRLAAILYWLSVLLWLRWAKAPRWGELPLLPIVAFLLSLLSYEAFAAMPIVTVLLAVLVYQRVSGGNWRRFVLLVGHLTAGHGVSYALFVYIRSLYRIENHIDPVTISRFQLSLQYGVDWVSWLWLPGVWLLDIVDPAGVGVGLLMILIVSIWLWRRLPTHHIEQQELILLLLTASLILLAGIAPFIAAGFSLDTRHPVGSRGYFAAAFGAALLVAVLLELPRNRIVYHVGVMVAAVFCGINATYHLSQRIPYQEAYTARQNLYTSLKETVPGLFPDTTLLYLNYNWQLYDGLAMVQWEMSSNYQTEMFYGDRTLQAAAVLDYETGFEPVVSRAGLYVPGAVVPLDQVVIIRRIGDRYELVDEITREDGLVMQWQDGIRRLQTNPDRIIQPSEPTRFQRLIGLD